MKPRIYVETSVVRYLSGGLWRNLRVLGDQFATQDWWRDSKARFELVASPPVVDEEGIVDLRLAHDNVSLRELFVVVHSRNASEVLLQQLTDSCTCRKRQLKTPHTSPTQSRMAKNIWQCGTSPTLPTERMLPKSIGCAEMLAIGQPLSAHRNNSLRSEMK